MSKRELRLAVVCGGLLLLGLEFVAAPFFLYWWIHGDSERYIWIISGPSPFRYFGGGPFQLWMGICLLGAGTACLGLARLVWVRLARRAQAHR